MKIKNLGKTEKKSPRTSDIILIYAGEKIGASWRDTDFMFSGSIFPGVEKTYRLSYEVPDNIDLSDTIVSVSYGGKTIQSGGKIIKLGSSSIKWTLK